MFREPTDAELNKIVLALHECPTVDGIDKLRKVIRDIHDKAIDDAVIVMSGCGLQAGFNPPHLNVIASAVRSLKWESPHAT